MRPILFVIPILTITLIAAWVGVADEPGNRKTPQEAKKKPRTRRTPQDACQGTYIGSRSCSSTACHGSVDAEPNLQLIGRNEFLVWLEGNDPHRFAHHGLTNKRAQAIFAKLGLKKNGKVVAGRSAEYEVVYQRCAACHNPSAANQPRSDHPQTQVSAWMREGVSCESCHGPAKKWVSRHYKSDFVALSAAEKCAEGMVDTGNIWGRAKMCAGCHVGAAGGKNVDHDFIAAGHPTMKFEFAAYQAILPKHWRDTRDRAQHQNDPDFALRMWITGQLASTRATLLVLADRAASHKSVWPEFSETDCYACHHDLGKPANWRQESLALDKDTKRVKMPWSSWHTSILSRLAEVKGLDTVAQPATDSIKKVRELMENGLVPSASQVATAAEQAAKEIDKLAATLGLVDDRPKTDAGVWKSFLIARTKDEWTMKSWERATQVYLGLRAIDDDRRAKTKEMTGKDKQFHELLNRIRNRLAFPASQRGGFDSPKTFGGRLQEQASSRRQVQLGLQRASALLSK